jgi:HEAT repeat protein
MPMTLDQLRNQLSAIEADESTYAGIGASEVPLLEQLLQDDEDWMAARAVFALSRVPHARAVTLLSQAGADPRQAVRVAVAASVTKLASQDANTILLPLLNDAALGVRKLAIRAVSSVHDAAVHAQLRNLETRDPAPVIRELAKDRVRELRLNNP